MTLCNVKGCGQPATKQPELRYWGMGRRAGSHPPLSVPVGLKVCDAHATAEAGQELIGNFYTVACDCALAWSVALPAKDTAVCHWWSLVDPQAPHHTMERLASGRRPS